MKLYYSPGTCSLATHTALIWVGVEYELERVEMGSDAYKKINPIGAVPALVDDDGVVMTQSFSLLNYIARKYANHPVCQQGMREQQQHDQWLSFLVSDLHPAYKPFFGMARFTTATDEESINAVKDAARTWLNTLLTLLDNHLAQNTFMLGDKKRLVDAYAYITFRWLPYADLQRSDYAHIDRYFNAMAKDEGIVQAETEQGIRESK